MVRGAPSRCPYLGLVLAASALATLLAVSGASSDERQAKVDVLRIGTSGALTEEKLEDSAMETLKGFIKEETGFENEIVRMKDWREVAEKMAKGDLHLGVFQGYEYAWAQEKYPELKPLGLAVNVYTYPVAYVVTQRDSKGKGFGDLQGQSFSIPATGQRYLRLFVERQCEPLGKKVDAFFSKITTPDNVEDALDDVVDGTVGGVVVDRAGLEAFKRRKPGRFNKLKEVARSDPFPPPLVAYHGKTLDDATRERFRTALLNANKKEKGEMMLTLFRLTGFVAVPDDFDKVATQTRKT
jgi:ABC-type phosphate/phosphonate transport system substrate-binding protein